MGNYQPLVVSPLLKVTHWPVVVLDPVEHAAGGRSLAEHVAERELHVVDGEVLADDVAAGGPAGAGAGGVVEPLQRVHQVRGVGICSLQLRDIVVFVDLSEMSACESSNDIVQTLSNVFTLIVFYY